MLRRECAGSPSRRVIIIDEFEHLTSSLDKALFAELTKQISDMNVNAFLIFGGIERELDDRNSSESIGADGRRCFASIRANSSSVRLSKAIGRFAPASSVGAGFNDAASLSVYDCVLACMWQTATVSVRIPYFRTNHLVSD